MSYWEFLRFLAWMLFTGFMLFVNVQVRTSKFAKVFSWLLFLIGSLAMLTLLVVSTALMFL